MDKSDRLEAGQAPVSKTRRKREMLALQELGAALVRLHEDQVRRLQLPEELRDAVLEAQQIRQHEARRRQLQYLGRLMRQADAEAIATQLADVKGESDAAKARFHALERWRDRLLEDEAAVTLWLDQHPGSDAQQLRQLVRNARRELEEDRPPKASRALFRFLRDAAGQP
jgi:ribosome-associated protein